MGKLRLIWVMMGPEELVALAMFLATVGVWAVMIKVVWR